MTKSKNRNSFLMTVTSMILNLSNGIFGFISLYLILKLVGSEYNGLNVSITQFVNNFMILEGGIGVIFTYHLIKFVVNKDYQAINSLISKAKKHFSKVGIWILILAIPISLIYSLFIKTSIPFLEITLLFVLAIFSLFFNVSYILKYKTILDVNNQEYVINLIAITSNIISQTVSIILLLTLKSYLIMRVSLLLGQIITITLLKIYVDKKYKYINFNAKNEINIEIKDTKDVLISRVIGTIYTSFFVIFCSLTLGTSFVSIYGVYMSIVVILKGVLSSIAAGPRVQFAQLYAANEHRELGKRYYKLEFTLILFVSSIVVPLGLVISNFVAIYTHNINDVNYYNFVIGIVVSLVLGMEILHIPAGHLMNSTGHFKQIKKIHIISLIVLVSSLIFTFFLFKDYRVIYSLFISSSTLMFSEVYYVNRYLLFKVKGKLKLYLTNAFLCATYFIVVKNIIKTKESYLSWFLQGTIITIVFVLVFFTINYVFNKNITKQILTDAYKIVKTFKFNKNKKNSCENA